MKAKDIIKIIEEIAPRRLACDWDNTGFQVGDREQEITGIYLALDATSRVIADAAAAGCNFLLTHHPLIFRPVRSMTDGTSIGRRLLALSQNHIAYYAAHTSYDAAPGMMADRVAERLGLTETAPIESAGDEGTIGRVGLLPRAMTAHELGEYVKQALKLPRVTVYSPKPLIAQSDPSTKMSKIGVLPGSGHDEIPLAIALGAEAYVTGDISHHAAIDAMEDGLVVIDAGHYGTEWVFMEDIQKELAARLPEEIKIVAAAFDLPGEIV